MLKAKAYLVDGGVIDLRADDALVEKYRRLVAAGVTGRELVHELYTDDWGPPPLCITISGTTSKGEFIDLSLDYPRAKRR